MQDKHLSRQRPLPLEKDPVEDKGHVVGEVGRDGRPRRSNAHAILSQARWRSFGFAGVMPLHVPGGHFGIGAVDPSRPVRRT